MISSEDLDRLNLPWSYVDQVKLRLHEPLIVNTDLSGGPGVHWIVLVKLRHGIVYMYDPLGPKNRLVDHYGRSVRGYIHANREYP